MGTGGFKALEAAMESADNIVDGISNAIVKAERNTVIRAKNETDDFWYVKQYMVNYIVTRIKVLKSYSKQMVKLLKNNNVFGYQISGTNSANCIIRILLDCLVMDCIQTLNITMC